MKVGLFDSGIGGLTVLAAVRKTLPELSLVYLGDNARAPYGTKSPDLVLEFTWQCVQTLFVEEECSLVILACNTASSEALRIMQREYIPKHFPDRKVLGVLIPTAEEAVEITTTKRIGVLATRGTVNSGAFERELKKCDPEVQVFSHPAPLLVPLIEEGWTNTPEAKSILTSYIDPLLYENVDTIILGCTHYPFLLTQVRELVGEVSVITSAEATAHRLGAYLERHTEISARIESTGETRFLTTGDPTLFKESAGSLCEGSVEKIRIY